jgi:signal transduction histidine kinase
MIRARYRNLSIQTRLFAAMFGPSLLIVFVVGTLVLVYDLVQFRQSLKKDAITNATIVARACRFTLTALDPDSDPVGASETLYALAGDSEVRAAALYTMDGKLFSQYKRSPKLVIPETPKEIETRHWFSVIVPVTVGAQQFGNLYVEHSLGRFNRRVFSFALSVLAAGAVLSVFAAAMARFLQGQFSGPVQVLAETARGFTRQRDFSLRAPPLEIPEFNDLRLAFNQMLQEIQQQNSALEKRSQELADINRQLLNANRELEAFTYSVSHDLRTPLRAVASYSQLAIDEAQSEAVPQVRDFLIRIQKNASKMAQLIDDLLAFSRIDARELERKEFSAEELVRAIWAQLVEEKVGKAELELKVLPPMNADRALMEQAFVNLLSNALKYTRPRENARVVVDAEVKEGQTIYRVADNGVGFDMRYYSKLFGVFQRLHTEQEFEGTGIGLAIVQRVIARHGGKIWAESELGKGATFYFTLG